MRSRKRAIGWGAGFIAAAVAGALLQGPLRRALAARAFPEAELRRYEAMIQEPPPLGSSSEAPPRTGKVVVVRPSVHLVYRPAGGSPEPWILIPPAARRKIIRELEPPRLDEAWFEIDPAIRAATPDEADTVVFCDIRTVKAARYVGKDPNEPVPSYAAYRRDALLWSFDRRTGRLLGSCVVHGAPPPRETTVLGRHVGEDPDIVPVINAMPLAR